MSIRPLALQWFKSKYGEVKNVFTSKFFTPDKSWNKKNVWFFQLPPSSIDLPGKKHVCLLCEKKPGKNDFHYLRVPISFILHNIEKFDTIGEKLALYLSAEPQSLFVEERGKGKLDFSSYLINGAV
ncbi:MAG: hypothetical protein EOP48_03240 [Sphingobacteriales bacterium]|nr:MAG: hypothetical protein EOP48_03240 [Sphingobacteriales bacterium]